MHIKAVSALMIFALQSAIAFHCDHRLAFGNSPSLPSAPPNSVAQRQVAILAYSTLAPTASSAPNTSAALPATA